MGQAVLREGEIMAASDKNLCDEYVQLGLAINEHFPGYVDSYIGQAGWRDEAQLAGKIPLPDLMKRVDRLAEAISHDNELNMQRKDYLARQVTAMQMTIRLLCGERVSIAEEVSALFDVQPQWKEETNFEEYHRELDQILPPGGSLRERDLKWKKAAEISHEKVRELLPVVTERLRGLARQKFDLPEEEAFTVEFVSGQPWGANNAYQGSYRSLVQINTDLPARIDFLPELIAHEGYPGHHTEQVIKEEQLIRKRQYAEHTITLLNTPSCLVGEGIATSALRSVLMDSELEAWFRDELLPRSGVTAVDAGMLLARSRALDKISGIDGNAVFMLYEQKADRDAICGYLQKYGLYSEEEAEQTFNFISNPLYRSYIFTYHSGHDLLKELFSKVDREVYFKRLLEEPVTPGQIRQWIEDADRQN
jgi:hypothetical protein